MEICPDPALEDPAARSHGPAFSDGPALTWRNSFARLGADFFTRLQPTALPEPYWVARSEAMVRGLGLDPDWVRSAQALEIFTGNALPPGAEPLASVYSGHQFGYWAGQLGDGRAILLGEIVAPDGQTRELQLKGAGMTPYSRMADGRAVLRSSIREFLCSEAMHALGIPTTRALCVTGSDAPVRRERVETAAVVTRVAPSFIRFGHFEHFAFARKIDQLRQLADYVVDRFYPECRSAQEFVGNPYANLLQAVSERTARTVAQWQAVGFCHGVLNTDNMSILGLTLDYGPFQFLDAFDPGHICNHSDTEGRYAFNRQPGVVYWNLLCLAQALLPLIGEKERALQALESYKVVFARALDRRLAEKLGLPGGEAQDRELAEAALTLLAADRVDYSIFWRRLSEAVAGVAHAPVRDLFLDREAFDAWMARYDKRLEPLDRAQVGRKMLRTNPAYVLRNHLGELAIRQAGQKDFSEVARLLRALEQPYETRAAFDSYAAFPPDWAAGIEISCSS